MDLAAGIAPLFADASVPGPRRPRSAAQVRGDDRSLQFSIDRWLNEGGEMFNPEAHFSARTRALEYTGPGD